MQFFLSLCKKHALVLITLKLERNFQGSKHLFFKALKTGIFFKYKSN